MMRVKKMLAVLLSATTICALGVPASAAVNDQALVDDQTTQISVSINGHWLESVNMPTQKMCVQPEDAENKNAITAADVLLAQVADTPAGVEQLIEEGKLAIGWADIQDSDEQGLYFTTYREQTGTTTYRWLNRDTYTTDGFYKYEYVGTYWQLIINNKEANYYASHYLASDIESIGFNFISDSFIFTRNTPIEGVN